MGQRVRQAREEMGWTPERLAVEVGVRQHTIYRIETAETPSPGWLTVCAISEALDVSLDWLAGYVDDDDEAVA